LQCPQVVKKGRARQKTETKPVAHSKGGKVSRVRPGGEARLFGSAGEGGPPQITMKLPRKGGGGRNKPALGRCARPGKEGHRKTIYSLFFWVMLKFSRGGEKKVHDATRKRGGGVFGGAASKEASRRVEDGEGKQWLNAHVRKREAHSNKHYR